MAIERGVDDLDRSLLDIEDTSKEMEVILPDGEMEFAEEDIEQLTDGTMLVGAPPAPPLGGEGEDFYLNLAEVLDSSDLGKIYNEALADVEADKSSRKEWEKQYREGLEYLGMRFEDRTEPFEGASGVVHPLLAESVTQFQSQAYKELLPAGGPVRTQLVGAGGPDADQQAARVQEYMNYQLMEVMREYDPETDQLLFYLPLSGSAFRKVHYDQGLGRAVSRFIPSEKLVVPYGTPSLESATRITHIVDMPMNDVRKLQQSGFYRKTDLNRGNLPARSGVQEEIDELQGEEPSYASSDDCEIYEMHVDLDIPGYEDRDEAGEITGIKLPYIVTFSPMQSTVLSIRRNWRQDDPAQKKIDYFVHYKFLPGVGFYGFGLTHMIGGLSRSATSILRQLIDAGTLANLPAGFKARGIRIRDSDSPLQPGEFRDMDAPGGSLREALMPLPFKEPSGTLLSLLGMLVESGQRFASISNLQVGDGNQEAPVGTTVALLERGSQVMSAIHKRLHYAQRVEFKLLANVFRDSLPPSYPYMTINGDQNVKQTDFDDRVDVLPVSDPNIFSMSQRVMLAQEMLQLVQSNPEVHGQQGTYAAYRRMYEAMNVKNIDELLPAPQEPQPQGCAEENAMFATGQPYQPFADQNHDAHIESHMAMYKTSLVQTNPQIQAIIQAHVYAHIGFEARKLAEQDPEVQQMRQQQQQQQQQQQPPQGMPPQGMQQGGYVSAGQPPPQQGQPDQFQQFFESKVAEICAQLIEGIAPLFQVEPPEDPLVGLRREEIAVKAEDVERKKREGEERIGLDIERLNEQSRLTEERIDSSEDIAEMKDRTAQDRLDQQREFKLADLRRESNKRGF